MRVKIDDTWYEVDDAVVKRMQEYYDTMLTAVARLEKLETATIRMRLIQDAYFKSKDGAILIRAIGAEKEVDDILAGRDKKQEQIQMELFK